MIYHNHHIIPKHMGGSDDPSNLVRLTIEEHAEAHKTLYDKYGKWEDKIAWKVLSGQMTHAEANRQTNILQATGNTNRRGAKHTDEAKAKMSVAQKKRSKRKDGYHFGETHHQFGKPHVNRKRVEYNGKTYESIHAMSNDLGIARSVCRARLRKEGTYY